MRDAGRRPMGRLFCWALVLTMAISSLRIGVYGSAPQDGATTTTVADRVYMADGTAVAAGNASVNLGANGALSVALVPNTGATPAGVYYTVVYQLGPG